MKHVILFLLFIILSLCGFSQIQNPVKWKFSKEQTTDREAVLIFQATIDKEWHIYSQFTPDGGPFPTAFTFEKDKCFSLVGKVSEPKAHEEFDSTFEIKVLTLEGKITLTQKVKLNGIPCQIKGTINGQVCKEVCILFDTSFVFSFENSKDSKKNSPIVEPLLQEIDSSTEKSSIDSTANSVVSSLRPDNSDILEDGCGESSVLKSDQSLWGIFIGGILGGLLALLTPCVFPMIPLTVSFFTKRSGTRRKGLINALIYAASIIFIYVSLGFLITVSLGSDALNELASSVFFNLLFFIIFVVFSISFFGAFEITLPSSWVNKADSASEKGGLIGIFFMAFTLSLVSFSCTGPIIGTLLVEAAHGRSYLGPLMGMGGFSLALALPFALFAMFPGWLQSLPKSGGWLNTVKVCLGFIELALALKFFSNVDLAYHWGILKREIFIALWVVIFGMMGFYLLGKIKLSHDSDTDSISTPRLLFAIITLTFTLYLIPGIWGAPLKIISGFPPPDFYKEWTTGKSESCPHDLNCFHDYDEGLAYARQQGKPVMIDFTGWSCVNCRKMEDNVWSDPSVLKKLREDFVLVSLYVDDKTPLPESEQRISSFNNKKLITSGNKWSEMQAIQYKTNSQPYYVLLDSREKLLAVPRGYTPSISEYLKYLDEGLCRYKKRKEG